MNDPEKPEQACPACGYPSDAGHAWNCPIDKKKREEESSYSNDYNYVDEDLKKFIIPHAAEGQDIHEISSKEKDIKIPVSFHMEGYDFYITGLQKESTTGVIIWGNISGDLVKIKHIEIAKNLRATGISKALLQDLEGQLKIQGVKKIYSAFYKEGTVEFLIKNGYQIIPSESLSEEERTRLDINLEDFDDRVVNEDVFRQLKANPKNEFAKILMTKELTI